MRGRHLRPHHAQQHEDVGDHDGGEQLQEILHPQVHHPEPPEIHHGEVRALPNTMPAA